MVDITPIRGVVYATEKDYGRLAVGQVVKVTTDAFGKEEFQGKIVRISPVFRVSSRQARIELDIANDDRRLKPGMFIRGEVELETIDEAVVVPEIAIAQRADETGIFLIDDSGASARWTPVAIGIRESNRAQVTGENVSGRVVTLGQHMLDDGSEVRIVEGPGAEVAGETGDREEASAE